MIVHAPASTSNLGPGFDVIGAALDFGLTVSASPAASMTIENSGIGADELSVGDDNLILRAARLVCPDLPSVHLLVDSQIPLGAGLGSSAAAIAAGLLLGTHMSDRILTPDDLLDRALELESHPDNLAATIFGGVTLVVKALSGHRVIRIQPSGFIEPVVLVPSAQLSTAKARGALPSDVALSTAVSNVGWTAALVALLTSSEAPEPAALLDVTQDGLHQDARAPLMPATAALISQLRSEGVAACVSGAGPSVLCLVVGQTRESVSKVVDGVTGWSTIRTAWSAAGAHVSRGGSEQ